MLSRKSKFKRSLVIALASLSMLATPVYADNGYSSDSGGKSVFVELLPIIVPTATVGGMILKSRTKKKSTSAFDYITIEVTDSTEESLGKVKTTESPSKNKYEKTSYVKRSENVNNASTVFNAIKEAAAKSPSDSNEGGESQ